MDNTVYYFVLKRQDEVSLPIMAYSFHHALSLFTEILQDASSVAGFPDGFELGYCGLYDVESAQLIAVDTVWLPLPLYKDDGVWMVDASVFAMPQYRYWYGREPYLLDKDLPYPLDATAEVQELDDVQK